MFGFIILIILNIRARILDWGSKPFLFCGEHRPVNSSMLHAFSAFYFHLIFINVGFILFFKKMAKCKELNATYLPSRSQSYTSTFMVLQKMTLVVKLQFLLQFSSEKTTDMKKCQVVH